MPVEAASTSTSREQQRRVVRRNAEDPGESGHSREIELKRSRGEVSCAECRRLKIKCDKKLPCSSCIRRGCSSLCPNGSLATGQGTRFVLAATDHLHRKIAKMSERIRQLEDALAILQSHVSDEPHHLLRDNASFKTHKAGSEEINPEVEGKVDTQEVLDAFGTLSMTDNGTRFFGRIGGTETLLLGDEDNASSCPTTNVGTPESHRDSTSPPLPPEITRFSHAFPFTPVGPSHSIQELIEGYLPPWSRAEALCETYLEHAGWLFHNVSRGQLLDEMMPAIYQRTKTPESGPKYTGPHDLTVLLMVFAVGALVDLTQEPYNAEAEHYYQLAKAAITLQSVLEKPEMATIQALHLMSIYNAMSQSDGGETSMELSWSLIRVCTQLGLTIGLHRDSARWGLDPLTVQRRRALFWDMFVADAWQSLTTGRPPSITLSHVDCEFPLDDESSLNDKGESQPSFMSWGFQFAAECVAAVGNVTLTAQVPSYATILDLDRSVREFPLVEFPADMPMNKPSLIMTRFVLAHSREVLLMCIHRSFFAQALVDDPVNPLRSQFAPSFLAAYRSAGHILKVIREQFEVVPELSARFWTTWTYALNAAIVFGTIVTRGPGSSMAPTALAELDKATEMFSRAAVHSRRAAKALVILQKLQIKGHAAIDAATGAAPEPPLSSNVDEKEDELSIFGGRTRLIPPKRYTASPSVRTTSSTPELMTPTPIEGQSMSANPVQALSNAQYQHGSGTSMLRWIAENHPEHPRVPSQPHSQPDTQPLYPRAPTQTQTFPQQQPSYPQHPHHRSIAPSPPSPSSAGADPGAGRGVSSSWQRFQQQPQIIDPNRMDSTGFPGNNYAFDLPVPQYQLYSSSVDTRSLLASTQNRDLVEMGLTSMSNSGLGQRWTSFMADSGVFYGNA